MKTEPTTTATTELAGKPAVPNRQFVISQANVALHTLVTYEAQYVRDVPEVIQKRILTLADFIQDQLKQLAAETNNTPTT